MQESNSILCVHACVPLCLSKNEEEKKERWERRVKCVCVYGGVGGWVGREGEHV